MTTIRHLTRRRRYLALSCLALVAVLPMSLAYGQADVKQTTRVLIVTGEDYAGHKWRETAPALMAELSKDPRLTVDVLADLSALATTRLDDYDTVVVHFKNYDPEIPGRQGFEQLGKFVSQGGGLVLLHFACGAFEEFKQEFEPLAGRVWFGKKPPAGRSQHDRHGRFDVKISEPNHPITQGMKDFETVDELYTCLEGTTPITVLATAVSNRDGKTYPMAFVLTSGKGRVFHCVLGHDAQAFTGTGPSELIRRGCAWTAGLEPGR